MAETRHYPCFKSPQLSAVCYKNEEQKERLQHILRSSKEYYRVTPLSFLKFSDAHKANEVGSPSTWVKLEKRSFESLKNAFLNPSELVSTEEPSLVKILNDLLQLPNAFGIPDLSDESQEIIKKYICALANTDGGYILLGVSRNKVKIGIPVEEGTKTEAYHQIVEQIGSCRKGVEPVARPPLNIYSLQANKVIVSLYIPKSTTLVNLADDGLVYAIKDSSISVLKAAEIEYLVEDKVMKDIELKISKRLQSVENECNLMKNLFLSLPIIRLFDNNSIEARLKPSLGVSINLNPDDIERLKKRPLNGTSRGTIFFLKDYTPPRLQNAYLRYTLPLFTLYNIYPHSIFKETIYLIPGGGAYYSNRDYPCFSERYKQILKLYKTSKASKYSMKFTVCFLKSSFLLWYLRNKYDDIDLLNPDIFISLRFPELNLKNPDVNEILHTIESNFDEIVNLENTFLINYSKFKEDELDKYINEHNGRVEMFAHDIDNSIYRLIGLSDDAIVTIENNLQLNNIYLPKKTPQLVSC